MESGPYLRHSTSRLTSSSIYFICCLRGKFDDKDFQSAEVFHATKSKLKMDHVTNLTNQCRNGHISCCDAVTSWLINGDVVASNSLYPNIVHKKLYKKHTKYRNNHGKSKTGISQVKETAWDKVIAYIVQIRNRNWNYPMLHGSTKNWWREHPALQYGKPRYTRVFKEFIEQFEYFPSAVTKLVRVN